MLASGNDTGELCPVPVPVGKLLTQRRTQPVRGGGAGPLGLGAGAAADAGGKQGRPHFERRLRHFQEAQNPLHLADAGYVPPVTVMPA